MWQVASKYYLKARGDVPEWVWNEKKLAYDSGKDIRARPYYANYVGADLSFSLRSNTVGGCPSGTVLVHRAVREEGPRPPRERHPVCRLHERRSRERDPQLKSFA